MDNDFYLIKYFFIINFLQKSYKCFLQMIIIIIKEVYMFQAIISICNLINMECVILKDKIGLINTQKECAARAEIMKKDFIDLYKGPVIIEKNCIKINKYKSI